MLKTKMRDVVILLPGITGSILQKDGSDIWALSGRARRHNQLWTVENLVVARIK
jgi:hypothetical protein